MSGVPLQVLIPKEVLHCVLNFLEQSVTDGQLLKLVFFLRSFYSIQLYERYDMLTEGDDENEDEEDNDVNYSNANHSEDEQKIQSQENE